ncbi:hypothetical protein K3495_g4657 [Podosphaera aphanis]|nr:hypothetical protein K3495_g4657 [Podosphaera aphanis]
MVKKAKNAFYRKKLEDANKAQDASHIAKWHKSKGNFHIPPLIDSLSLNSPPDQSNEEKRDVLFNNLLQNHSNVEDTPPASQAVARVALPFPELTLDEPSNAVLNAGNTNPGKDGIPTAVLRRAWPHISRLILELFQSCIDTDHHPQCFRRTILIVIGKPNKADMSLPRSFRPIALLSVLGKSLERLVARRMAWTAIRFKVICQQQFGALPLRSSVDLTTCFTHYVEIALAKGERATVATLDIKGAFDAVLPGRLIRRPREQGWPAHLCNWISSFATGRKVCIRLDSEEGTPKDINYGLPQGSPISPILFMLYTSLFRLDNLKKSFGYADDVAILETSPFLDTNANRIRTAVNQVVSWGTSEGITFDPGKSELLHFSRRPRDKGVGTQVVSNSFIIVENPARPYLKWLGVHFDRKLSFQASCSNTNRQSPKSSTSHSLFWVYDFRGSSTFI